MYHSGVGWTSPAPDIARAPDVSAAIVLTRDHFGLEHVILNVPGMQSPVPHPPYLRSTLPADWIAYYLLNGLMNVDPIHRFGFNVETPFFWRDAPAVPGDETFWRVAEAHGISRAGYAIPIIDRKNRRALATVSSALEETAWRRRLPLIRKSLMSAIDAIYWRARAEINDETDALPELSPREIECLGWTSRAKSCAEIAVILGLSEHTARGYLKDARLKLECATLAQATAKAERCGLLWRYALL